MKKGPHSPSKLTDHGLRDILEFARAERGFESAGYCPSVMETRVQSRLAAAGVSGHQDYLQLLRSSPCELDLLIEALTLKVSSFFRNPVAFEYLREAVLPAILMKKAARGEKCVRVWSAGCACGEEPYSVALLLHALALGQHRAAEATLFATDIDEKALARGREALYPAESLASVPYGLATTCFQREGDHFRLLPSVARAVSFSAYDMLDRRTNSPADSVFGTFDLILCRNLLIYFQPEYQDIIVGKLYRSLAVGGYLLLGQTEMLPEEWQGRLRRVTDCCRLYRKGK